MKKFQRLVSVFALTCVVSLPAYADGGTMSGDRHQGTQTTTATGTMSGDSTTPTPTPGTMSGDVVNGGTMSGDVVTPNNDSQSSMLHSIFGWFGIFGF